GTASSMRPNVISGVPIYVTGATCAAQYGLDVCPGGRALNIATVTSTMATAAGCITTGLPATATTPFAATNANAKGAFCTPAAISGTASSGNLGRNVVRSYPLQELDFSVHRDFPFTERVRLRFQADMFNVFNHPSFGGPATSINSATFGLTTSMANSALGASAGALGAGFNPIFNTGGPRNTQFALTLFF